MGCCPGKVISSRLWRIRNELLDCHPGLNKVHFRFQNTPLHFAAELGHLGCLRELLEFKFEINAQNEDDKCPLHLAAEKGRLKCVQELVKADKATVN